MQDMSRPYSPAQGRAVKKYMSKKSTVRVYGDLDMRDRWKAAAEAEGQSLNQFVIDTVETRIRAKSHK